MLFAHTARVAPEKTDHSARPAVMPFAESFGESEMATKKLTYTEQIKHPNWQKRRLEMLEFYGWACGSCDAKDVTLHVHHKQYFKGRMAWEYSQDELEVLCEKCHQGHHKTDERIKEILAAVNIEEAFALLAGYFSRYGEIDPGVIEEGRQSDGLSFASGFTASLFSAYIDEIEEVAVFAVRNRERLQEILAANRSVYGHKDA